MTQRLPQATQSYFVEMGETVFEHRVRIGGVELRVAHRESMRDRMYSPIPPEYRERQMQNMMMAEIKAQLYPGRNL